MFGENEMFGEKGFVNVDMGGGFDILFSFFPQNKKNEAII